MTSRDEQGALLRTQFQHTANVSATGVFQVPAECAGCNCQEYDEVLKDLGAGPNTYCYPECSPR